MTKVKREPWIASWLFGNGGEERPPKLGHWPNFPGLALPYKNGVPPTSSSPVHDRCRVSGEVGAGCEGYGACPSFFPPACRGSPTTHADLETPTKPTPRATPPPRPTLFRKTRQVVHDEASDSDSDTEAGSSDASSSDESDGNVLATGRPAPSKKMRRAEAPPDAELLAIGEAFGDGIELGVEDDDEGFRRRKGRRSSALRTKRSTTARGLRGEGVARRLPGVPRSSSEGRVSARGRLSREDVDAAIAQRQAEVAKAAGALRGPISSRQTGVPTRASALLPRHPCGDSLRGARSLGCSERHRGGGHQGRRCSPAASMGHERGAAAAAWHAA